MSRSIPEIMTLVAAECGITPAELKRHDRRREMAPVRQLAMWVVRCATGASVTVIGEAFGRDHSTVCYALPAFDRLRQRSPAWRALSNRLLAGAKGVAGVADEQAEVAQAALKARVWTEAERRQAAEKRREEVARQKAERVARAEARALARRGEREAEREAEAETGTAARLERKGCFRPVDWNGQDQRSAFGSFEEQDAKFRAAVIAAHYAERGEGL